MLARMMLPSLHSAYRSRRVRDWFIRVLFLLLPWLAFAAAVCATGVAAYNIIPLETTTKGPGKPDYDKDKEDIKRYLEWVIAVSGIFAIAQTVAAGFAAQSFTRQAERDLQDIEEWKAKYANLADLDEKQNRALLRLREAYTSLKPKDPAGTATTKPAELVDWLDWRRGLYESMQVLKRQELLSIDRYLGFDLKLNRFEASVEQANIIRMLANFYVSKYEYDDEMKSAHWDDLERAEYLLRLWTQQHPEWFQFHNDLGLLLVKYRKHFKRIANVALEDQARNNARAEFRISVEMEPRQQRAYFNLAVMSTQEAQKPTVPADVPATQAYLAKIKDAVAMAEKALTYPNWETKPDVAMRTEICYNLACYRALVLYYQIWAERVGTPKGTISATDATPVLDGLDEVALKGTIKKKYVEIDFTDPTGDLAGFRNRLSAAEVTRLDTLRPKLSANSA